MKAIAQVQCAIPVSACWDARSRAGTCHLSFAQQGAKAHRKALVLETGGNGPHVLKKRVTPADMLCDLA